MKALREVLDNPIEVGTGLGPVYTIAVATVGPAQRRGIPRLKSRRACKMVEAALAGGSARAQRVASSLLYFNAFFGMGLLLSNLGPILAPLSWFIFERS